MDGLARYIGSVTAAALLCGLLTGVMKQSRFLPVFRLICGIFLTICVLKPFSLISGWNITRWEIPQLELGMDAAEQGSTAMKSAMERIITQETQAYILDIAKELGLDIEVSLELSTEEPPIPIGVSITGNVSPYKKLCLEEKIVQELNIPKENQQWIG